MALSAKQDKPIIFETALQYFLCLVPLSLAHPDGTTRKMNAWMSALMKVIKSFKTSTEEGKSPPKWKAAFSVDLMALIWTVSPVPVTYAQLVKIVSHLPKVYRVDIIAKTYRGNSSKNNERNSRGVSTKVIIRSASWRIPRNFIEFLKNGDSNSDWLN